MASQFFPTQVATLTGTGSAATLISATNHKPSTKVWKLLLANSSTSGAQATFSYTASGSAGTLTLEVPAGGTLVLPYDGAEYINGDTNTAITCNAPSTVTVQGITRKYTKSLRVDRRERGFKSGKTTRFAHRS